MRIYSNLDETVSLEVDRSQSPIETRSHAAKPSKGSKGSKPSKGSKGSKGSKPSKDSVDSVDSNDKQTMNENSERAGDAAKKLFNNIKSKLFSFPSRKELNELNNVINSEAEANDDEEE